MTLIDDKKLAKMQKTQELNLPEIAHIQQLEKESDGQGGWIETSWQTVSSVSARIGEPKGELEKEAAGQIDGKRAFVITMPVGTVLEDDNQVQINGVNYRVHWTNKNRSNITAIRAVVTEAKR